MEPSRQVAAVRRPLSRLRRQLPRFTVEHKETLVLHRVAGEVAQEKPETEGATVRRTGWRVSLT